MIDLHFSACSDCFTYIASSELPQHTTTKQDNHFCQRIKDIEIDNNVYFSCDGSDLGFSSAACECCGSKLAGYRFLIIGIKRGKHI